MPAGTPNASSTHFLPMGGEPQSAGPVQVPPVPDTEHTPVGSPVVSSISHCFPMGGEPQSASLEHVMPGPPSQIPPGMHDGAPKVLSQRLLDGGGGGGKTKTGVPKGQDAEG